MKPLPLGLAPAEFSSCEQYVKEQKKPSQGLLGALAGVGRFFQVMWLRATVAVTNLPLEVEEKLKKGSLSVAALHWLPDETIVQLGKRFSFAEASKTNSAIQAAWSRTTKIALATLRPKEKIEIDVLEKHLCSFGLQERSGAFFNEKIGMLHTQEASRLFKAVAKEHPDVLLELYPHLTAHKEELIEQLRALPFKERLRLSELLKGGADPKQVELLVHIAAKRAAE